MNLLLKYSFHLQKESDAIENAVEKVLDKGLRTSDLATGTEKAVSCQQMGAAVVAELKSL